MKKQLRFVFALLYVASISIPYQSVSAAHLFGMEMSYTCTVTPGVYLVRQKIFRDCNGTPLCGNCNGSCIIPVSILGAANIANSGLPNNPYAGISYGIQTLFLETPVVSFDVGQLCNMARSICTECNTRTPGTFTPGIEIYTFSGNINLNALPASCCLVSISYTSCCRSAGISPIFNVLSTSLYNEMIINRCAIPCNSSPIFTNDPVNVVAAGMSQNINLGAVDPDGDSLSYVLGPIFGGPNSPANYIPPYSPTAPFPYLGFPNPYPPQAAPYGINFNQITGTLCFISAGTFSNPLIIDVYQWKRNGNSPILMGMTRREGILTSNSGGGNNPPVISKYNQNGILISGNNMIDTICAGQTFCRTFAATDIDLTDTTDLSLNTHYPLSALGMTFTRLYSASSRAIVGPRQDSFQLCWTPVDSNISNLPYLYLLKANDRRCPLMGRTDYGGGIFVRAKPFVIINKFKLDLLKRKFTYTRISSDANNPLFTQWQIETSPGSNTFTSINSDSINSYTFGSGGNYKLRLNLSFNCGIVLFEDYVNVNNAGMGLVQSKNISCKGDSSGLIIVKFMGGVAPVLYRINSGVYGAKDTFANLKAGSFRIIGKDSLNTRDTLYINLTQPANSVSLAILTQRNPSCTNDSNGMLVLGLNNGIPPLQYRIENSPFQTNDTFNNLKVGSIWFTAKDSLGCRASENIILNQAQFYCTAETVNLKCHGDQNGMIRVTAFGGVPPYQYKLGNTGYSTNNQFSNLTAGNYTISTKDSNQCLATIQVILGQPLPFSCFFNLIKESCPGKKDASVDIVINGGTPPYSVHWQSSPVQTGNKAGNLGSGFLKYTITDSNQCLLNDSVFVSTQIVYNNEQICGVSIDSISGKAKIIWNKTAYVGIAKYFVFKSGSATGPFSLLDSIPFSSASVCVDPVSLTPASNKFYRLIVRDSCNQVSSGSLVHRPMLGSALVLAGRVKLNWTRYVGTSSLNQLVWKRANGSAYILLKSLNASDSSFIDSFPVIGSNQYLIELISTNNCHPYDSVSNLTPIYSNVMHANINIGLAKYSNSSDFEIYPNPATGIITLVKKTAGIQINELLLYSLDGKVLKKWKPDTKLQQEVFDVSEWSEGMYQLILSRMDGTHLVFPLIIER